MRRIGLNGSLTPHSAITDFGSIVTKQNITKCFCEAQVVQDHSAWVPGMYPAVRDEVHSYVYSELYIEHLKTVTNV